VEQRIEGDAPCWNEIVDLAILLEPVYGPISQVTCGWASARAAGGY
jgi:hypothetical protein